MGSRNRRSDQERKEKLPMKIGIMQRSFTFIFEIIFSLGLELS